MKKKLSIRLLVLFLITASLFSFNISVGAKSLMGSLQDAQREIEEEQNDEVSDEENSISGVMKSWSKKNNPDEEVMKEGTQYINSTLGTVLSMLIMIFFAGLTLTTAIDLLYICFPPVRPVLYDGASGQGSANLHSSVMHGIAQNESMRAQQAMMQGDFARANMLQNRAVRSEAEGQYRDANWFGNKDKLAKAQNNASGIAGSKCFISSELKQCIHSGAINVSVTSNSTGATQGLGNVSSNKSMIITYFKKRSVALVLFTVCIILFTSSVFSNFGINVGNYILYLLGF